MQSPIPVDLPCTRVHTSPPPSATQNSGQFGSPVGGSFQSSSGPPQLRPLAGGTYSHIRAQARQTSRITKQGRTNTRKLTHLPCKKPTKLCHLPFLSSRQFTAERRIEAGFRRLLFHFPIQTQIGRKPRILPVYCPSETLGGLAPGTTVCHSLQAPSEECETQPTSFYINSSAPERPLHPPRPLDEHRYETDLAPATSAHTAFAPRFQITLSDRPRSVSSFNSNVEVPRCRDGGQPEMVTSITSYY